MSTIKISELATSDITLSDFFAKADANGLATKNTIQGLSTFFETVGEVGFKGSLAIVDTPTLDGWYFATESGTYTNAGNLVIDLSDNIAIIIVSDTQTNFEKVDIPITLTIDATPTAGSTNAVQSGGAYKANKIVSDKIELTDTNLSDIGTQTNLLKKINLVDGSRVTDAGDIFADVNFFRTNALPITELKRYASVSSNTGQIPRFSFYNSSDISAANLVGFSSSRDMVAPATATHLVFQGHQSIKEGYVLKQLDSGYPVFGEDDFIYNNIYKESEVDAIVSNAVSILESKDNLQDTEILKKIDISKIGEETNLLIKSDTIFTDGYRTDGNGNDYEDAAYFRTNAFEIDATKRIACSSSNNGELPRFAFYNSNVISNASFLGLITNTREVNIADYPVGTTHLVFSNKLTVKDTSVLQYIEDIDTFPRLDLETFDYSKVATKEEVNKVVQKDSFIEELNYLKKPNSIVVDEFRQEDDGDIIPDNTFFIIKELDVVEGERFATVSDDNSLFPRFSFYSSNSVFDSTTAIGTTVTALEATVPATAKKMFVAQRITLKDTFILRKLSSGFPSLGEDTSAYKSNEFTPPFYGDETNILKKKNAEVIDGKRTTSGGAVFDDDAYFMLNYYPVTEGQRFACVSDTGNPIYKGRFTFYTEKGSNSTIGGTFISDNEATAPAGAKWMIFAGDLDAKDTFILQQLDEGFPKLNERTVELKDTYDKEYLDANFDKSKFYPDVFDIDINYVQRDEVVLEIDDENDTLYGTNGGLNIFKATQTDLSDLSTVCILSVSNSTLTNLVKVSDTRFAGYVANPITLSAQGFYKFDATDPDNWIATRVSDMLSGFPDGKFQNFFKVPKNNYLYACSYSLSTGKDGNPVGNEVDPAPRHIYRSIDNGDSWQVVYTHPLTTNTHIHAIEYDVYRDRIIALIGDEGLGGTPGWAWSDDWGVNWDFVENDDSIGQTPFMDTALIPTRKGLIVGSDYHPAGIRQWIPTNDVKHAPILAKEVTSAYIIPYETDNNFAFARRPVVDVSSYPHKVAIPFSHNADYSKAAILLTPNFYDWYMVNLTEDPQTTPSFTSFSGITSDGTVVGWCHLTGVKYYFTFKFPNWVKN